MVCLPPSPASRGGLGVKHWTKQYWVRLQPMCGMPTIMYLGWSAAHVWDAYHHVSGFVSSPYVGCLPSCISTGLVSSPYVGCLPSCIWVRLQPMCGMPTIMYLGSSPAHVWDAYHHVSGFVSSPCMGCLPSCIIHILMVVWFNLVKVICTKVA